MTYWKLALLIVFGGVSLALSAYDTYVLYLLAHAIGLV